MNEQFAAKTESTRTLATDQLMNAIYIVTRELKPVRQNGTG